MVITFNRYLFSYHLGQESYGADSNYLKNTIKDYFSDTRNHEVNNAYKTRAKEFIFQEFNRNGLETEYHVFNYLDLSKTVSNTHIDFCKMFVNLSLIINRDI